MAKSLCKWRRNEIATDLSALRRLVKEPTFVCMKCARVANDKDVLCSGAVLKKSKAKSKENNKEKEKSKDKKKDKKK